MTNRLSDSDNERIARAVKACTKCGEEKPIEYFGRDKKVKSGLTSWCRQCHAESSREYRRNNREKVNACNREYSRKRRKLPHAKRAKAKSQRQYRENYPEKRLAHSAVSTALYWGKLTRSPCVICGSPKSQAHHDNYARRLDVTWLCQKHHRERHRMMEHGHD